MLAVIPARGGSKGIPHKNVTEINGKPLLVYSLEVALMVKEAGIIDEVIVSSDDIEIIEIAQKFGASVPFIRPQSLASDTAKSIDLLIHAYEFYLREGIEYENIILLQPTTPLREVSDILNAVALFYREKADSLISCYKEEYICELVTYKREGERAIPLDHRHNEGIRRQEAPDYYVRNGAIYIVNSRWMQATHKIFGGDMVMYEMTKEKSVNIDTYYDLELVKWLLGRN